MFVFTVLFCLVVGLCGFGAGGGFLCGSGVGFLERNKQREGLDEE